ncbi:MAG TPA: hypothetical protein PK668_08070 [Myxococcota bacterium]|nr:hypothetical protein [Myxococcota bacterium]HRY93069.1 hypothetical protein [Myxococcota bacterium]HSA24291.1 hypothetical protein [Myxococcota bacterium]
MEDKAPQSPAARTGRAAPWLVLGGLGLAVAAFLAWVLVDAGAELEAVLQREDSPVAWLTSALFCMTAALALIPAARGARPWLHGLVGAWCAAAALDEWFMLHEALKERILFGAYGGDLRGMGIVGDLPLAAFAALGGGLFLWLTWRTPRLAPRVCWLVGLGLGGLALAFDLFLPVETWHAVEDILEPCAAAALLAGSLLDAA